MRPHTIEPIPNFHPTFRCVFTQTDPDDDSVVTSFHPIFLTHCMFFIQFFSLSLSSYDQSFGGTAGQSHNFLKIKSIPLSFSCNLSALQKILFFPTKLFHPFSSLSFFISLSLSFLPLFRRIEFHILKNCFDYCYCNQIMYCSIRERERERMIGSEALYLNMCAIIYKVFGVVIRGEQEET